MNFKLDLIEPHRIKNNENGIEVTRGCLVTDIPIDPAVDTDERVFLKVLQTLACPKLNQPINTTFDTSIILKEHRLVSVGRSEKTCRMDLVYRGDAYALPDAGGGSPLIWQLDSDVQIQVIQTSMTAGGANVIKIWYDSEMTDAAYSESKKVGRHVAKVSKLKSHRVLRAQGWAKQADWNVVKASIYDLRNHINADVWGTSPRGTWYFPGPVVSKIRGQTMLRIQLMFIEAIEGHFPIVVWHNREGKIPHDISTETQVRGAIPGGAEAGPPAIGTIKQLKGITMASIYDEHNFSPTFDFTPDDI